MKRIELMSFEYSVHVFNEIMKENDKKASSFEIVWNTSLGIATANTVLYENDIPVISFNEKNGHISKELSKPEMGGYDLFSTIRESVFNYFFDGFSYKNVALCKTPEFLFDRLLELSKARISNDEKAPTYSTTWNFKTIDKTIEIPFIKGKSFLINEPISLILKS